MEHNKLVINECLSLLNKSAIRKECKAEIRVRLLLVRKIMHQDKFRATKCAFFAGQHLENLLCEMRRAWTNPNETTTISNILVGAEAILAVVGANGGAGASSESG